MNVRRTLALAGALLLAFMTLPAQADVPEPPQAVHPGVSEWPCGDWGMYGRTLTRQFSSDCPTSISPTTVASLVPAWVFRVPAEVGDQSTFTTSPVIVDNVVYIGGWNGVMYALDGDDGSVIWEYQTPEAPSATYGPIIASAAIADLTMPGLGLRRVVVFGSGPILFALDAEDGSLIWSTDISVPGFPDAPTEFQSSPLVYDGKVFIGSDVHNKGGDITGGVRGGIHAFDVFTGANIWSYFPEEAAGQPAEGCGGVWGSPTLDTQTGLLYFGTANCPAVRDNPALPMEEITALVADTGEHVWTFRPHQPEGQDSYDDEDQDFGATPNLYVDADGRKVLGAGNKDGAYYALDPATGEVFWSTHVSEPAPGVGGFIGSPAVLNGRVFGATAIGSPPSYHGIDATTGDLLWQGLAAPSYAASAAINGVVFAGGLDFTFKAFDAETGRVLWATPMPGAVSSGAAIAGDLVVVGSGTSTSDACAKDNPTDETCIALFDTLLGQQGAVHAFRPAGSSGPATEEPEPVKQFVLSPEGNHLWAYDADTNESQLVIPGVNAGDPGAEAPAGTEPRDINGQVCVSPDGAGIITGEDTVLEDPDGGGDGGSSHDPRIAGWGYFAITGDTIGEIRTEQIGKLAPEAGRGPGYTGDPDNHGCGFLDEDRLFTTGIGDILPGDPANGQLFLWFGPFDAGYEAVTENGITFFLGQVDHCSIDDTLATAGGMAVDTNGDVYVASNRPDDAGNAGAIWRYTGNWPTSFEECTPEFLEANITREMVIPPVPVLLNPISPTPSSVTISPDDTLYVSSVFSGTVTEYSKDGIPLRDIYPTSPLAIRTGPTGDTPFGLVFTDNGSLWIADLGIVTVAPVAGEGSLIRVDFDDFGQPTPFGQTVAGGLTFPDGVGVYTPPRAVPDLTDDVPDHVDEPAPDQDVSPSETPLPATGGGLGIAGLLLAATMAGRHRQHRAGGRA